MKNLNHVNILQYIEYYQDLNNDIFIVMELANGKF